MSGRALLASPLGFLIGVSLGALGGGGSVLAVPVLVFVAGQQPSAATTSSLVIVGVASLIGAHRHWRNGWVRVGPGLAFGLVGVAGSLAGTGLNRRLDGDVLLLAFAGLLLVAAWRIVAGCPGCTRTGETAAPTPEPGGGPLRTRPRPPALTARRGATILGAGTAVGFLTAAPGSPTASTPRRCSGRSPCSWWPWPSTPAPGPLSPPSDQGIPRRWQAQPGAERVSRPGPGRRRRGCPARRRAA